MDEYTGIRMLNLDRQILGPRYDYQHFARNHIKSYRSQMKILMGFIAVVFLALVNSCGVEHPRPASSTLTWSEFDSSQDATNPSPRSLQSDIHVGVIGDSMAQGSFAETTLGHPFPKHYAKFYDRHLHHLAQLKFAPSLAIRSRLGRLMGKVFEDFWYSYSFIANPVWGLSAKFQQHFPSAQIHIHSRALMAATSGVVQEQVQALFAKDIAYDYFFFAIGANDVCSADKISPESFGKNLTTAFDQIRSRSTAPIYVLEVSPLHKVMAATDTQGQSILDRPIDYSEFYRHFGPSALVARVGLLPRNCREHIQIECPYGINAQSLEATVAQYNAQLITSAQRFPDIHVVQLDQNTQIQDRDLAADCFHPNVEGQKKFFETIELPL